MAALPLAPAISGLVPAGPSGIQIPVRTPAWFSPERAEESVAEPKRPQPATRPARSFVCSACNCTGHTQRTFVGRAQVYHITDVIDALAQANVNTEAVAAVAGGSVGVMGTLVAVENAKKRSFEDSLCLYCGGFGELACGMCVGAGCDSCQSNGRVPCFNCQGTGHAFLTDGPSPRAGGLLGSELDAPYS
eukprot:tig00001537_g9307.t1